jgi:hypothetical protein
MELSSVGENAAQTADPAGLFLAASAIAPVATRLWTAGTRHCCPEILPGRVARPDCRLLCNRVKKPVFLSATSAAPSEAGERRLSPFHFRSAFIVCQLLS